MTKSLLQAHIILQRELEAEDLTDNERLCDTLKLATVHNYVKDHEQFKRNMAEMNKLASRGAEFVDSLDAIKCLNLMLFFYDT